MYIWDIFILRSYLLFFRNSDLIRCPVFYLTTLGPKILAFMESGKTKAEVNKI